MDHNKMCYCINRVRDSHKLTNNRHDFNYQYSRTSQSYTHKQSKLPQAQNIQVLSFITNFDFSGRNVF